MSIFIMEKTGNRKCFAVNETGRNPGHCRRIRKWKKHSIRAAMGLLGEGGMVTQGQILYQGTNATIDMTQIHGEEMRRLRGAEIGMIFQNAGASLCPIRTIEEQLYEAVLEHESISKGEIRDRAGII
ncbi:MAG: hypothetical protein V8R46_06175 [Eubacterium ramulus]